MNLTGPVTSDDARASRPVFISYATADRKEALSVCKAIERRGTKCWISTRDVEPGANYQEAIVRAIRQARAMVLVFSDAANNSDEIKKELSLASRHHVPVMALRIEDVEPSDAFAYELSTRQWIDAFAGWDRSIDSLVRRIGDVADAAPAATASQSPQQSRRRVSWQASKLKFVAGAAAFVMVIGGGAWWFMRGSVPTQHTMEVRLAGFQRLSNDLPATLPEALADEMDAAFNKDGVIAISRAASAPPGTAPAYAMNGTILHEGDKVKVITHLVNERSGTTLWTYSHSFDAANLGQVPHWAAVDASYAVRCGLFGASTYSKALSDQTLSTYLQLCSENSATKSLDLAHKVVAAVPDFSWGWSAVELSALGAAFGEQPGPKREQFRKEGIAAAEKAIQLDPSNSEAYSNKSYLIDPKDFAGREALLKKGIASRALACGCEHHLYGNFLMDVGRVKDALQEYNRSTDVQPLNGGTQIALGDAAIIAGYPEQSKDRYDAAVDLVDQPQMRDEINIMTAPLIGKYASLDAAVHNPKIGLPAALARGVSDSFAALQSGSAQAKSSAAAEIAALPPEMTGRLTVTLLGALADNADALKQTVAAAARGNPDATSWLFYPSMAGTLREASFPSVAQRLGLMAIGRRRIRSPTSAPAIPRRPSAA